MIKYELQEPVSVTSRQTQTVWNTVDVFDSPADAAGYAEGRHSQYEIEWGFNNFNEIVGTVQMREGGPYEVFYKIVPVDYRPNPHIKPFNAI